MASASPIHQPVEMPVTALGVDMVDVTGDAFTEIIAADLQVFATGKTPPRGGEADYVASRDLYNIVRAILELSESERKLMERMGHCYTPAEQVRRLSAQKVFAGRLVASLVEGYALPWQRIESSTDSGDTNA